jgi:hypothetical protein
LGAARARFLLLAFLPAVFFGFLGWLVAGWGWGWGGGGGGGAHNLWFSLSFKVFFFSLSFSLGFGLWVLLKAKRVV